MTSQASLTAAFLFVLMLLSAVWGFSILPADVPIAVHFSIDDQVNGWMRPWPGLFVGPMAAAACWLLCHFAIRHQEGKPAAGMLLLAPMLPLAAAQALILGTALGQEWSAGRIIAATMALMWILIGNVLGKLKLNHTAGIRSPWSITDERVWDRTQRFGGWALVMAGFVTLLAAIRLPAGRPLVIVMLAAPLAASLLAVARSYQLWRALHPDGPWLPPRQGRTAKPWFRPKTIGIGYTPNSWQGWLVTLLFCAALVLLPRLL